MMLTLATYSLEKALRWIRSSDPSVELKGYRVRTVSLRLRNFMSSQVCAYCGLQGSEFRLEMPKGSTHRRPHLNMYSVEGMLMTHDHIVARINGGADNLDNTCTSCARCNEKKDRISPEDWHEAVLGFIEGRQTCITMP